MYLLTEKTLVILAMTADWLGVILYKSLLMINELCCNPTLELRM